MINFGLVSSERNSVCISTLHKVCTVQWRIFGSVGVGRYLEYITGCSVHWGDTMTHVENIMSRLGDVQYVRALDMK